MNTADSDVVVALAMAAHAAVKGQAEPPALWNQAAFLIDEQAAAIPTHCQVLYAVLVADKNGRMAAVMYFAAPGAHRGPLLVLDYQCEPLTPALVAGVLPRLAEFSKLTQPMTVAVFATSS